MGSYVDSTGRFRQTERAFIRPAANDHWLAAGTPLAAFANGASTTPGLAVDSSEGVGIRWNNDAAPAAVFGRFVMPPDRKPGSDITMHFVAAKSGATSGDATTFTVTAFNNLVGALFDADSDFGGISSALVGTATAKTVQRVTLALANVDLAAVTDYAVVSYSFKPTAGLLGTDDITVNVFFEYERVVTPV